MKIETTIRGQLVDKAASHLSGLLGQSVDRLTPCIDSSIGAVLHSFRVAAGEEIGRETLYEAVRYCDDTYLEQPSSLFEGRSVQDVFVDGNIRLASLVGIANQQGMIKSVAAESNVSEEDAENTIGYMVPGILGVIKREIARGEVLDTPDGIGQIFLGEGPEVSAEQMQQASMSAARARTRAGAMALEAEETDQSWMFRFFLPLLLVGGLVFGGLKDCGNGAAVRVASSAKAEMQNEIDGLLETNRLAGETVTGLQTEVETVSADNASLKSRVDDLTLELKVATDSAAKVADLEQSLLAVTAERDAATESTVKLQDELNTIEEQQTAAIADIARLETQLEANTQELDQAQLQTDTAVELTEMAAALEEELSARQLEIDRLTLDNSGLQTTIDDLHSQMQQSNNNSPVVENSEDLEAQLGLLTESRDKTQQVLSESQKRVTVLSERIVELEQTIEVISSDNEVLATESELLQEQSEVLDAELTASTLSSEELRTTVAAGEETVLSLRAQREDARSEATKLTVERDELVAERDALQLRVEELNANSGKAEEVDSLTAERDQLLNQRGSLQARLSDLMSENETTRQALTSREVELDNLATELAESRASNDDSVARIGVLSSSLSGVQQQLSETLTLRDEVDQQVSGLEDEVSDLKTRVEGLTGELNDAREQTGTVQAELEKSQKESELLQNAVDKEKGAVAQLTENIEAIEKDKAEAMASGDELVAKLEANLVEAQKTSYSQQADIEKLDGDKQTLQAELDTARESAAALEKELTEARSKSESLQNELFKAGNERTALQTELESVTSDKDALSTDIESAAGLRQTLEKQLADSNVAKNELESRLSGAKAEIADLSSRENTLRSQIETAQSVVQAEKDATNNVQALITERVSSAGLGNVFVDSIDEDRAVAITLGSGDLYRVGSARLSNKGNGILDTLAIVLAELPDWRVDVEGHTDGQGIGSVLRETYPTNWELSTARASAAVRYLQASSGIDSDRLSARGFGDTRPIDSNETAVGRERNRRVELILRPK